MRGGGFLEPFPPKKARDSRGSRIDFTLLFSTGRLMVGWEIKLGALKFLAFIW